MCPSIVQQLSPTNTWLTSVPLHFRVPLTDRDNALGPSRITDPISPLQMYSQMTRMYQQMTRMKIQMSRSQICIEAKMSRKYFVKMLIYTEFFTKLSRVLSKYSTDICFVFFSDYHPKSSISKRFFSDSHLLSTIRWYWLIRLTNLSRQGFLVKHRLFIVYQTMTLTLIRLAISRKFSLYDTLTE